MLLGKVQPRPVPLPLDPEDALMRALGSSSILDSMSQSLDTVMLDRGIGLSNLHNTLRPPIQDQ